jgi:hypothetical protein
MRHGLQETLDLTGIHGLGQVMVEAGRESAHFVLTLAPASQSNRVDIGAPALRPHPSRHLGLAKQTPQKSRRWLSPECHSIPMTVIASRLDTVLLARAPMNHRSSQMPSGA